MEYNDLQSIMQLANAANQLMQYSHGMTSDTHKHIESTVLALLAKIDTALSGENAQANDIGKIVPTAKHDPYAGRDHV